MKSDFILDIIACFAIAVSMSSFSPKGRAKIINRCGKNGEKKIHGDSKDKHAFSAADFPDLCC